MFSSGVPNYHKFSCLQECIFIFSEFPWGGSTLQLKEWVPGFLQAAGWGLSAVRDVPQVLEGSISFLPVALLRHGHLFQQFTRGVSSCSLWWLSLILPMPSWEWHPIVSATVCGLEARHRSCLRSRGTEQRHGRQGRDHRGSPEGLSATSSYVGNFCIH